MENLDGSPDRRKELRREEDQDQRDQLEALNYAVFGFRQEPGVGLMQRMGGLERKINWLIFTTSTATIALAGAIIQRAIG